MAASLCSLGLFGLAPVSAAPVDPELVYVDVSSEARIGSEFYSSTDHHSLGVNWIDFNNDSWPDLFAVNGFGQPAHLYMNSGDGTFTSADHLLPPLPNVAMSGSIFADYDNDGDSDLYIFTDNEDWVLQGRNLPDGPRNLLLKNLWIEHGGAPPDGEPLFVESAGEAGVADLAPQGTRGAYDGMRSKAGAWLDYDRDGCVDLYVGHMAVGRAGEASNADALYRNLCDGTFERQDLEGPQPVDRNGSTNRPLLAMIGAHLDDDLWPDLYLVHASAVSPAWSHHDLLYRNVSNGTFEAASQFSSGELGKDTSAGMGIDVADIDLDGYWDLYITDLLASHIDPVETGNALYFGLGGGEFSLNQAVVAQATADNSWGVVFLDADHDGYEDVFVGTMASATHGPFILRNLGNRTFSDAQALLPASGLENCRGAASADYDRDGDLDLAVVNEGGRLRLLENRTEDQGRWLSFLLEGTLSNSSAIGAVIQVDAGALQLKRQVTGGSSAHSQNSLRVHFGVGGALTADRVAVSWPSGLVTEWFDVPTDAGYLIIEQELDP